MPQQTHHTHRATITGMPARLISFPFRLDPSGTVVTVEQGSDRYVDEQLAVALLTARGERILAPTFGCDDPAFVGFELGNLMRHLTDFGPEVDVTDIRVRRRSDDTEEVTVTWSRRGGDDQ